MRLPSARRKGKVTTPRVSSNSPFDAEPFYSRGAAVPHSFLRSMHEPRATPNPLLRLSRRALAHRNGGPPTDLHPGVEGRITIPIARNCQRAVRREK